MSYATMRTDVQDIIDTHGQQAQLIRQVETMGSMGTTKAVVPTGYTIIFIMQDITRKDRKIHEMGLAIPGNVKGFFYHEYPDSITGNGTLTVRAGDLIEDKYKKLWRIEQILGGRKASTKEIFRSAVLRKIDLNE